jgi:hypothetical protein
MTQVKQQIGDVGILPESEGIFDEVNSLLQQQIDAAANTRRGFLAEELELFAWRNEQIRLLLGQLEALAA